MNTGPPLRLTDQQMSAVNVEEGSYLLVAPPGSGKTEVLVRRVIRLLQDSEGQTFRVLALTFTTKAAESLRARVLAVLGEGGWRLTTGTFHAFCLDVLQHYGAPVGVAPNVTVLAAPDERADALQRALENEGYVAAGLPLPAETAKELLSIIDRFRADLVAPAAATGGPIQGLGIGSAQLYQAYDTVLTQLNAIDFPAMLQRAHQLLTESSWTLDMLRRTYRYVLVDEAQDTNFAQFEFLQTLVAPEAANLFLVADRNQAIYGFAGSDTKFVDDFLSRFHATQLPLTSNFRSAQEIVDVANKLAEHLPNSGLGMTATIGALGHVEAVTYPDEPSEARAVAQWIANLIGSGLDQAWGHEGEDLRIAPEQVCVLGRTRFALDPIRKELEEHGIDTLFRTGEGGLFDSELGQATYFMLRVLCNPLDRVALRKSRDGLGAVIGPIGGDIDLAGLIDAMQSQHSGALRPLAGVFAELSRGASSVADLVRASTTVEDPYGDPIPDTAWASDRVALARFWRMYEIQTREHEQTLPGFVQWLSTAQRGAIDEPGVRLLTVHAAKGLEFRAVAIIGMNEGTFPHFRALNSEKELGEERRSAYVAVTRAARVLLLSRPRSRVTRSGPRAQDESRFVGEMGVRMRAATS